MYLRNRVPLERVAGIGREHPRACAQLRTFRLVTCSDIVTHGAKEVLEHPAVALDRTARTGPPLPSARKANMACCQAEGSMTVEMVCEWVFMACIHCSDGSN